MIFINVRDVFKHSASQTSIDASQARLPPGIWPDLVMIQDHGSIMRNELYAKLDRILDSYNDVISVRYRSRRGKVLTIYNE